jgi:hypothetical protein
MSYISAFSGFVHPRDVTYYTDQMYGKDANGKTWRLSDIPGKSILRGALMIFTYSGVKRCIAATFICALLNMSCWMGTLYAEDGEKTPVQAHAGILPDGWQNEDYSFWFNLFTPVPGNKMSNGSEQLLPTTICKRENFDLFFNFFSEDIAFQYTNTQFPLKLILWNMKDDKPVELWVIAKHYSESPFTIFPDRARREEIPLMYILELKGRDIVVKVFQEDSDYMIEYMFSWNDCWRLVQIEDPSI